MVERERGVLAYALFTQAMFRCVVDSLTKKEQAKIAGRWLEEHLCQIMADVFTANSVVIKPRCELTPRENREWISLKERYFRIDGRGKIEVRRFSKFTDKRIDRFLSKIETGV